MIDDQQRNNFLLQAMDHDNRDVHNAVPDFGGFDSTAGSIQSHLSTTNSQQRLRATAPCHNIPKRDPIPLQNREQFSSFTLFFRRAFYRAPTLPQPTGNRSSHSRSWSTLCFKWAVCTYCLLSFVIFSVSIYKHFHGDRRHIHPRVSQHPSNLLLRLEVPYCRS